MPRPERSLDPQSDPLHEFAAELRQLRDRAGNPTYLKMARQTGRSRTALSEAAGGDQLPSWHTVEAFVRACGDDPNRWRPAWERVRSRRDTVPSDGAGGLSNLPRRPAQVFRGRQDALAELGRRLEETSSATIGVAVHGLGGVGKTELVLRYAFAHRQRYTVTWWINADTEENIAVGLVGLARAVGPAEVAALGVADATGWAIRWLGRHGGWLLVLDNVVDPAQVEPLSAVVAHGHVVVTSRRDLDWRDMGLSPLRLSVLPRSASVELLMEQTGRRTERDALQLLAADVGDLPLALRQVAAYLQERLHVGVGEYRRRLAEQPWRVLDAAVHQLPAVQVVARTWQVTMSAIARQSPHAASLMDIAAYLASDMIPVSLFDATGIDALDNEDALALIASYNMITREGSVVFVHRLVQAVTRAAHTGTDAGDAAVKVLVAAMPEGHPATDVAAWPRWMALAAHVRALATTLDPECLGRKDPAVVTTAAHLFTRCAMYHLSQGRHATAIFLAECGLAARERVLGSEHPDTVTAGGVLAGCYWAGGRQAKAIALGEATVAARERILGPEHPDTLETRSRLTVGYREIGRFAEAIHLGEAALDACVRILGPEHPDTLHARNNLAGGYRAVGRYTEAIAMDETTLAFRGRMLGLEHPDTLQSRNNLAGGYRAVGRYTEAIAMGETTLAIRERLFGPEHPDTLRSRHDLARGYSAVGRSTEAYAMDEETLTVRERLFGPEHPDTLQSRHHLRERLPVDRPSAE